MSLTIASTPEYFQLQSPLFGKLPGEIRNEIFELALIQQEDEAAKYPENSYWYRPGFRAPRKSNSALLRTCKIAYADGRKVFSRELELAFWFDRGPEERTGKRAFSNFFRTLDSEAVEALQKVRFFTEMFWLEGGFVLGLVMTIPKFRPIEITITIRYSDWWSWDINGSLTMSTDWLENFAGNPGLRKLRVEYETISWKRDEMLRIVERNKNLGMLEVMSEHVDGGDVNSIEGYLDASNTSLSEWKWKGPSDLGGWKWSHHGTGETIEYVVITDTWVFVETVNGKARVR